MIASLRAVVNTQSKGVYPYVSKHKRSKPSGGQPKHPEPAREVQGKADTSPRVAQRTKINWSLDIKERDDLTPRQRDVLSLIEDKNTKIIFLLGPAGSAKTYLGVLAALRLMNRGSQSDLIYIRSIIESASKSMGSLPGDSNEKLQPFIMPLMDKLEELLTKPDVERLLKEDRIKGVPVNYVRGASWNAKFILVDESQNLDFKELTTVLTRLGRFSKMVVVADPLQSDLNGKSGFLKMYDLFNDESSRKEGIHCIALTSQDIVRSGTIRYLLERIENLLANQVKG